MATGTSSDYSAQTPTVWADDLFYEAENLTFFSNWEGEEGSGMPIIRKDDLTKEAGDTIKVDIALALRGAGVTGDLQVLEGNEEELRFRQMSFSPEERGHAVAWTGKAERRISHEMRTTAKNQLRKWLAGLLDDMVFDELSGAGTTIPDTGKWAAGTATTRNTVADTDAGGKLTVATIQELRAYAKSDLKIEPVLTEDGEEFYILVAHPYALLELKRDDTKWSQMQRDAQIRGDKNPVFTGAAGMVDGVILKESNRVNRSLNVGSPIQVADNILLGANAMVRGYGMYPTWVEGEFDYKRRKGVATTVDVGQKITAFDLTVGGAATDAQKTWVGGMVVYSAAVAPGQP